MEEFRLSDYFLKFLETFSKHLDRGDLKPLSQIVSFGLGKFFSCPVAKTQLLLLLALKKHLTSQLEGISVFDPIFCDLEIQLLKEEFGIEVPSVNTEGVLEVDSFSLLYFPHCPKQLTNNFLWSNWRPGSLSKCFIVANSFDRLVSSLPDRILLKEAGYIKKVAKITEETPLENCYKFEDIFNDLSLHSFHEALSLPEKDSFWDKPNSKPEYSSHDIEYIAKSIIP